MNVEEIVNRAGIIERKKDALDMPILGRITDPRNIEVLQYNLRTEKRFNNPGYAYNAPLKKYKESNKKYGLAPNHFLYERDKDIQFIDVDVFRQPALYFKKNGKYCPYDPKYDVAAHTLYWDTQEYRRKYGMTAYAGISSKGERVLVHCPGNYYGFLNFSIMNKVEDDDFAIDNESDFIDSDAELDDLAMFKLEELISGLGVRTTKTAKKVIDFPNFFDAQYHLIVAKNIARLLGLNFFFVKARRKGCSYFNAWDQLNNIDLNPNISCILAAYDKKYLIHGKGLMKMVYTYADFLDKFTDWNKSRLVSNKEHLKFGFYPEGSNVEHGFLSEMLAVSAKNNPDVTIGKDVYEISFEEMGKFPNFEETENVTSSTAEAGEFKTGMLAGWGTGGTDEANWEPFEKLCYNPRGRNVLACNNIWDEGQEGTASIYMYAHVDSLEGCMDYNGNTDYDLAWSSYRTKLEEKKNNTKDEVELEKWIGQRANSPSEAFARSGTNLFNRVKISYQLKKIESTPSLQYIYRHGVLVADGDKVVLRTNDQLKAEGLETHPPIFNYPLRSGDDMHGCFVEYFPPYINPHTGKVPDGLYLAMQDPYAISKTKDDISFRDSLGVTYWYELPNNITQHRGGIIVASYIGRPPQTDDYNAQVYLGLRRYNSKLAFEANRGDTLRYMRMMKALHYLFPEPDLLTSKGIIKGGNTNYGLVINDTRKGDGAKYLKDLLEMPLARNADTGELKTFIDYCYDPGFLKELLRWNLKGNFDRVSAWIVGMFFIKQLETIGHQPKDVKQIMSSFFNREMY